MTYNLVFTSKAKLELNEAALWWSEHRSTEQAIQWLEGFHTALQVLTEDPERFSLARENDLVPYTLRQLHYGTGAKPTHRALFRVRDSEVIIYGVRHLAQDDVSPDHL